MLEQEIYTKNLTFRFGYRYRRVIDIENFFSFAE